MRYLRLAWVSSLLTLLLLACGQETYPVVRLNEATVEDVVGAENPQPRMPLRVAIAAVLSPEATFETYRPLLTYLSEELDRPVELLQRGTYAEVNELVRTGQADVAFVCGGGYVEGERLGYMTVLVVPQVNARTTYQAVIIARADAPYQSLEDLRGTRFAFTDPLSNSGRLYVQYRLWEMGETPETFFKHVIFTYAHDNSVHAVAENIVDAASVDSIVLETMYAQDPTLRQQIREIERSPNFGIPPVVVHPNLDPALRDAVEQVLLNMHNTPEGRAALRSIGIERFVQAPPNLYDDIRHMAATVRGWTEARGNEQ
ncbi:MAG: phosphate/phosphite/phosphonate ABC transporter substrate-binding protein [Ardenticatenia bacterium]|nr:MAG: phosphate/phosphite/phosphonate ABC transporter substrate-binding protein [Ardenticatenia bacterium]